jgi:hypothetical protein
VEALGEYILYIRCCVTLLAALPRRGQEQTLVSFYAAFFSFLRSKELDAFYFNL